MPIFDYFRWTFIQLKLFPVNVFVFINYKKESKRKKNNEAKLETLKVCVLQKQLVFLL